MKNQPLMRKVTVQLQVIAGTIAICSALSQATLVAHWKLDEGFGPTTIAQTGGSSADGTLSSGCNWVTSNLPEVPGGTQAAVSFQNSRISTQCVGVSGTAARTVAAWIKASSAQSENAVIVGWGNNSNGNRFSFRINTGSTNYGRLRLEVQGGYVVKSVAVNDDQWHHVAVVVPSGSSTTSSGIKFYIDGQLDPQTTSSQNQNINTGSAVPVGIGGSLHSDAYDFTGQIDEVMIFDQALSADEIMTLIQAGPQITGQPQGRTFKPEDLPQTTTLTLATANPANCHYQWYQGLPGDISHPRGQDSPTLEITLHDTTAEGYYYCRVTQDAATVESEPAYLRIDRLRGWWPLDNTLTNALNDGHDGQMIVNQQPAGTATYTSGIDGQALSLSGDGAIMEVINSTTAYNFYPEGFTISLWAKTAQTSWGGLVGKAVRSKSPWSGFLLNNSGTDAIFTFRSLNSGQDSKVVAGTTIADDSWHLLTGTYDRTTGVQRFYLDGLLVAQANNLFIRQTANTEPLVFGRESIDTGSYYIGQLDDIRLWNYALDPFDVGFLYYDVTGKSLCVQRPAYDWNGDCLVNLADLTYLLQNWLESGLTDLPSS